MGATNHMAHFRKKPVVIEAFETRDVLACARTDWRSMPVCIMDAYERGEIVFANDHVSIATLEGVHRADLDDKIIKGVKGELYPCKPDIFAATYEAVD